MKPDKYMKTTIKKADRSGFNPTNITIDTKVGRVQFFAPKCIKTVSLMKLTVYQE